MLPVFLLSVSQWEADMQAYSVRSTGCSNHGSPVQPDVGWLVIGLYRCAYTGQHSYCWPPPQPDCKTHVYVLDSDTWSSWSWDQVWSTEYICILLCRTGGIAQEVYSKYTHEPTLALFDWKRTCSDWRVQKEKKGLKKKKKKKKKGIGTIIRRRSAIQKQSCLFLILLCFLPGFAACKVHLNGNSFVSLYKTKSVPGSEVDHGWTRPDPKRDMETNFRITTAETMVLELICAGIRVAGWCPSVLYHGFTQEVFRPANYPILRRAAIFEQHGGFVYTI